MMTNGLQNVDGLILNMEGGNLTIENCIFDNVVTEGNGGAFYLINDPAKTRQATFKILHSSFSNMNASTFGGVIYLENFNLTIENSSFGNYKCPFKL